MRIYKKRRRFRLPSFSFRTYENKSMRLRRAVSRRAHKNDRDYAENYSRDLVKTEFFAEKQRRTDRGQRDRAAVGHGESNRAFQRAAQVQIEIVRNADEYAENVNTANAAASANVFVETATAILPLEESAKIAVIATAITDVTRFTAEEFFTPRNASPPFLDIRFLHVPHATEAATKRSRLNVFRQNSLFFFKT